MSDKLCTLDLTTKKKFTGCSINEIKTQIQKLDYLDALQISETCELNIKSKIEIYLEGIKCQFENPEDLLDLVVEIEKLVGDFEDGSLIQWVSEFPHNEKNWKKQGFDWQLILEETDDYYLSEIEWEDDWEE